MRRRDLGRREGRLRGEDGVHGRCEDPAGNSSPSSRATARARTLRRRARGHPLDVLVFMRCRSRSSLARTCIRMKVRYLLGARVGVPDTRGGGEGGLQVERSTPRSPDLAVGIAAPYPVAACPDDVASAGASGFGGAACASSAWAASIWRAGSSLSAARSRRAAARAARCCGEGGSSDPVRNSGHSREPGSRKSLLQTDLRGVSFGLLSRRLGVRVPPPLLPPCAATCTWVPVPWRSARFPAGTSPPPVDAGFGNEESGEVCNSGHSSSPSSGPT